jgi:hypothetical protein
MKRRSTVFLLVSLTLLFVVVAPTFAAGTSPRPTFADVIAGSRLVVLARIHVRTDGGLRFRVERVLKGHAGRELSYPPLGPTPPVAGWSEAVIAFADPRTDDFRAPTIAWHVAQDGVIDPERFQRYPGLPATLDAMLRYFGAPATNMWGATVGPVPPAGSLGGLFLVGLAGLAGLALGHRRFARRQAAYLHLPE